MSKHYNLFCDTYGIEPTCEDCEYFIQNNHCSLEDDGIGCNGESEFTTRYLITHANDPIGTDEVN